MIVFYAIGFIALILIAPSMIGSFLSWAFPCSSAGPSLHAAIQYNATTPRTCECLDCGASWVQVIAGYQPIVADGDTVYQWERTT